MSTARPPSCTGCGQPLKPHCHSSDPTYTPCTWWRCPSLVCTIATHDFTRGVRVLRDGKRERFVEQG